MRLSGQLNTFFHIARILCGCHLRHEMLETRLKNLSSKLCLVGKLMFCSASTNGPSGLMPYLMKSYT